MKIIQHDILRSDPRRISMACCQCKRSIQAVRYDEPLMCIQTVSGNQEACNEVAHFPFAAASNFDRLQSICNLSTVSKCSLWFSV
jgi:hypothetical protein